jgi:hypothetical protein
VEIVCKDYQQAGDLEQTTLDGLLLHLGKSR